MAMKGMDVEGGRQASQQMAQGGQEIEALGQRMTTVIEGFEWQGPDAERTRESWRSEYLTMLKQVTTNLQEFSTLVNTQAQEQEQASN